MLPSSSWTSQIQVCYYSIDLNLSWRIGEVKQAGNVDYTQDIPTICQAYSELFGNKVSKPRTKAGVCNALKIAN